MQCACAVLTLNPLTWKIWWANNASRWQMGFNSAFKGLKAYCHLWPVWLYYIFPDYLLNDPIFGRKLLNWAVPCGCSAQVAICSAQAATLRKQDFRPTWSVLVKSCHAIIGYSEGGGESQGRCPWAFVRVVLFRVEHSSTWLLTIDIWDRWAGQSRKCRLLQTTISERASQTSGMCRKVKVWFFTILFSKLKFGFLWWLSLTSA